MCIGIPMRVIEASQARAVAEGRGFVRHIDTRLVGAVAPGQWLLVFQDAARERLDAGRAAEIDAALDLLDAALGGDVAQAQGDPGFALPSSMDAAQLARLTGSEGELR